MEEWLCQPLIIDPLFLTQEGVMLGKRTRLKWVDFDGGEVGTKELTNFFFFDGGKQKPHL